MNEDLIIRGARQNNLKNIDLTIPRNKFIVFTGLSGSGKSSLAFDTIYAEGQRRYVESLSSYARMFLGQMEKPDVDGIEGLSPAISIDQKTTSKNPRSTVGTTTEIYDYLRLLYARVGIPHCPVCGIEIKKQPLDQIVDRIMEYPEGTRIQILAPVIRGRKGEFAKLFADYRKSGYVRARVDGVVCDLMEEIPLEKNKKHDIEIVVDRLSVREDIRRRLTDSCETASRLSKGLVLVTDGNEDRMFSQRYSCPEHDIGIEELSPRMFSFNNPMGACKTCSGIGYLMRIDPDLVLTDRSKTILDGAVSAMGFGNITSSPYLLKAITAIYKAHGDKLSTPVQDVNPETIHEVLYGNQSFEGIIPTIERRYKATSSAYVKAEYESMMSNKPCPDCGGARLNELSLAVTVGGLNIDQFCHLSIGEALNFIENLVLSPRDAAIASLILKEIKSRLGFLKSVGLEYLTLARSSATLSGGESQRIR
ncbi:MAG: excinuclease ABC subunit UvrA, partial [Clostridia bacterium]|nr:excinuclease ABC subunit UvrA [Clostridia bacterium]